MAGTQGRSWVATTPEAILRAEGLLNAWADGREGDMAGILATDQGGGTDPVHLLVALVAIADRATAYAALVHTRAALETTTQAELTREAAKTVADAYYRNVEG